VLPSNPGLAPPARTCKSWARSRNVAPFAPPTLQPFGERGLRTGGGLEPDAVVGGVQAGGRGPLGAVGVDVCAIATQIVRTWFKSGHPSKERFLGS
jgi:hypothetical protein